MHTDRSKSVHHLLCAMTTYDSQEHAISAILQNTQKRPTVVSFLNQHAVNLARNDEIFHRNLMSSDFLLRDGAGVELACRALNLYPGANLNGTDLIPDILQKTVGRSLALYGTAEPWLSASAKLLTAQGHTIVSHINGFQNPDHYLEDIRTKKPSVVILAMGMPRQEALAQRIAYEISSNLLVLNGGAILDFLANRFTRAPLWMQKSRLEWLYRLAQEPKRLAHRYVVGIPIFIYAILEARRNAKSVA